MAERMSLSLTAAEFRFLFTRMCIGLKVDEACDGEWTGDEKFQNQMIEAIRASHAFAEIAPMAEAERVALITRFVREAQSVFGVEGTGLEANPIMTFTPAPKPRRSRKASSANPKPSRRSPIARSGRVKQVNAKRKAKTLVRAFGSPERRAWMRTLPCFGCCREGFSVSAHIANDGLGRRAGASQTIPLCCASRLGTEGCHQKFDRHETIGGGPTRRFGKGSTIAKMYARRTAAAWQSHQSHGTPK